MSLAVMVSGTGGDGEGIRRGGQVLNGGGGVEGDGAAVDRGVLVVGGGGVVDGGGGGGAVGEGGGGVVGDSGGAFGDVGVAVGLGLPLGTVGPVAVAAVPLGERRRCRGFG